MEYQKRINLLDNTQNEPSKFRTRTWIEINDESRGTYNFNNQINFKTSMIRSDLCDYGGTYIYVKGTITIDGAAADNTAKRTDEGSKGVIFNNCATFTACIGEITSTQIYNAKDIDVVMPIYDLIEYSDSYSKTSESLWQYYRVESANRIQDSKSFKSKTKITGNTPNCNWSNKLFVPVTTLSTQGNIKLLKQLELGFKRIINWNKHQAK